MGFSKFKYAKKRLQYAYSLFFSHFEAPLATISFVLSVMSAVASLSCLISLIIYIGYDLSAPDRQFIWNLLRISQGIFAANVIYDLVMRFRITIRESRAIKWIVDIALLLTVLAWIYPNPEHPWIPWLKTLLYSRKFLFIVLGAFSMVNLSYTLSRIPSRRTNPSLLMAASFIFFIIIGSFVLMLPKCTYHGISYFDSLFVSSSAVCITGLTPVDIPSTFTPLGIIVLSVLVQLGGLGVITFTSFFALFFTGNTSIYNQLLIRDMIYSKSMNALMPTLLYVLGFTIIVEIGGAFAVYFTVPDTLGLGIEDKIMFSAFHSMSSFCNAGFSCLPGGMANEALMHSNQYIYIVTSVLIFAGAIGFPILVNFKEILKCYILRAWYKFTGRRKRKIAMQMHIYDLNTKIVLATTITILIISSVAFFVLEGSNSMSGMSTYEKIVQAVFNSLITRSAGYASINPNSFLDVTILLILLQMVIGGSSQSMAGGIKVNTLGAILLNLRSVLFGHEGTSAFNRTINHASVRRANAIMTVAAIGLTAYCIVLLVLEPHLPTKSVIFEVVSALFTVGSSLGITPMLSDASKAVLCSAMFLGRVGILSLLCGLMTSKRDLSPHLPTDNIIIN